MCWSKSLESRISGKFLNGFTKYQNAKLLAKIRKAIENVEDSDAPHQICNFKKLKGSQSYFRIRIGEYRFGLKMEGDTLIFVRFLSRKEIY